MTTIRRVATEAELKAKRTFSPRYRFGDLGTPPAACAVRKRRRPSLDFAANRTYNLGQGSINSFDPRAPSGGAWQKPDRLLSSRYCSWLSASLLIQVAQKTIVS